uniref:basic salivary proline-rich protein 1-like n=1 Tax=Podarcis muralis TaxID=64176 RepID=UPI0010A029BC|nr:basic salivary proline-rich protein 1-like [Podarcis muralis]
MKSPVDLLPSADTPRKDVSNPNLSSSLGPWTKEQQQSPGSGQRATALSRLLPPCHLASRRPPRQGTRKTPAPATPPGAQRQPMAGAASAQGCRPEATAWLGEVVLSPPSPVGARRGGVASAPGQPAGLPQEQTCAGVAAGEERSSPPARGLARRQPAPQTPPPPPGAPRSSSPAPPPRPRSQSGAAARRRSLFASRTRLPPRLAFARAPRKGGSSARPGRAGGAAGDGARPPAVTPPPRRALDPDAPLPSRRPAQSVSPPPSWPLPRRLARSLLRLRVRACSRSFSGEVGGAGSGETPPSAPHS